MKKITKKILALALALVIAVSTLAIAPGSEAEAYVTKAKVPSVVRCGIGMRYYSSFSVLLTSKTDKIKSIKVTKGGKKTSNIKFKITSSSSSNRDYSYGDWDFYKTVSFYATSAGTYKMKLKIKQGTRTVDRTVTIYAYENGYNIVKNVTLSGKSIYNRYYPTSCYTDKKSGKVKFTLANGCKIKQIKVHYYDQNGDEVTKAFKNGKKIALSSRGYSSTRSDYSSDYTSYAFMAYTRFEIIYTDKANLDATAENTTNYYIYRKATTWP